MNTALTSRQKVMSAPVLTYFKALILQASTRARLGGSTRYDYSIAGYELCRHLGEYVGKKALNKLFQICSEEVSVRDWIGSHLATFYALVPTARRAIFLRGFLQRLEEGDIVESVYP